MTMRKKSEITDPYLDDYGIATLYPQLLSIIIILFSKITKMT